MGILSNSFCVLVIVVAVVYSLPADQRTSEPKPFGRVELEKDAEPVYPTDTNFFDFGDIFERVRQQMLYLMNRLPRLGFDIPEGGNTTSVTKVINGHKVVINETVYANDNGDSGAVFKVRVVDIHPENPEFGIDSTAESDSKASPESLEQSMENEISKNLKSGRQHQKRKAINIELLEDELDNRFNNLESFKPRADNAMETFDELDNANLETMDEFSANNLETFDEAIGNDEKIESIENEIESFENEEGKTVDLSRDILINKIAALNNKPVNPDAESVFEVDSPRDLTRDIYVNEIAKSSGQLPNPDAEVFDPSLPYVRNDNFHDLSRDTYINEIDNLPINPDAEVFHPFPRSRYYYKTDDS